jgi:glycosyltransferase involved in cell wall biosynthesis
LIDPEDVSQYADALSSLLSDSDERARLGQAALERCRKMFDWEVIAETWMSCLQSVTVEKLQAAECA